MRGAGRRVFNLATTCFLGGAGLVVPIISGSLTIALMGFIEGVRIKLAPVARHSDERGLHSFEFSHFK